MASEPLGQVMAVDFANLTPKQNLIIGLGGVAAIALAFAGIKVATDQSAAKALAAKIASNNSNAQVCISLKAASVRCDQVDKSLLEGDLLASFEEIIVDRQAIVAKKAELRNAALAKMKAEENARKERVAAENRASAAKFKAEGWWEQEDGVFVRWCTNTCSNEAVIGSSRYSLMEVWCKERACGDIYAQVNFERNGTTVGWTNDTLYLGYGSKGVLTFQRYGSSGSARTKLVKFQLL